MAWSDWYSYQSEVFGTSFELQLWADNQQAADGAMQLVEAEMWRIHHLLSPYESESELSFVNGSAGIGPVDISAELSGLLATTLYYSELTEGAFDPSFASVGWYYDYKNGEKPDQELIDAMRPAINYRLIMLDTETHRVDLQHKNMKLDLGGSAKGYAMDRAAEILRSLGIEHATVSAGGDMRVLGDKRGRPWVVGIRNPRQEQTAIRLPLENVAVSTSGDYERFFIDTDTGDRIHHILDPSTGQSADKLASVTVIGERGIDTDPLSTSIFVLGAVKGLALINSMSGFDAILIDSAGRVHFSQGLSEPE